MADAWNGLIIRPALPDDADALCAVLNEIIAVGGTTALEDPLSVDAFSAQFLNGPSCLSLFTALESASSAPVGFQSLTRHPDLPDGWGDIATFARIRRKRAGVGSALFARTLEAARDLGLTTLNAAIRADNTGGLAFYEKMGFRTYQTLPNVPLKSGAHVDRVLKRRGCAP